MLHLENDLQPSPMSRNGQTRGRSTSYNHRNILRSGQDRTAFRNTELNGAMFLERGT